MLEVKFYDSVDDSLLKFAVIVSQSNGKWVFCKHKERDTYEVPGGHREAGESILETAKRELQAVIREFLRMIWECVQMCWTAVRNQKVCRCWSVPCHRMWLQWTS